MTYEFGSCKSSKDKDIEKFLVVSCDGKISDKARTLREAEVKADAMECSFVLKILRACGGASVDSMNMNITMPGQDAVHEEAVGGEDIEPIFGIALKEGESVKALVTMEECPACADLKNALKEDLETGKIVEIMAGTSTQDLMDNAQIIEENNMVEDYPGMIEITRKDGQYQIDRLYLDDAEE